MATMQSLTDRVRLELADARAPFTSQAVGDGVTQRFELPYSPVEATGFTAYLINGTTQTNLALNTDYTFDALNGVITTTVPVPAGQILYSRGTSGRFFSDADLNVFIGTAFLQHTHGRNVTVDNLPPVEDYLIALLATQEALYALMNDSAFDIDVNTPDGVSVPRSQRFRQLMEMLDLRKKQYTELAVALNVGLNRIEMFNLRRVSRTTGRYVPTFLDREIEDASPPRRVYQAIDQQGADNVIDPARVANITVIQGEPFSITVILGVNITGRIVKSQLRRYDQSSPLYYFDVFVNDPVTGSITVSLADTSRRRLYVNGDLAWSITANSVDNVYVQTLVKGKVLVVERPIL